MGDISEQNDERWIIIYLIYADFINAESNRGVPLVNKNLLLQLDSLCEDLIKCKLNEDKYSVYAILSTLNYIKVDEPAEINTFAFSLKPKLPGRNRIDKLTINFNNDSEDELSIHKIKDLSKVFDTILKIENGNYKCKKKIQLITWDHGSAFGIFRNSSTVINQVFTWESIKNNFCFFYVNEFINAATEKISFSEKRLIVEKKNNNYLYIQNNLLKLEKGLINLTDSCIYNYEVKNQTLIISYPDKQDYRSFFIADGSIYEPEILTNYELSESIRIGFGQRIDILVMMNCWMMNLDTAYWLKEDVTYLIAPQTGIDYPAYNYSAVMNFIYKESKISNQICTQKIIETWITSLILPDRMRVGYIDEIASWAIFAIDLTSSDGESYYIDLLFEHLNRYACKLIEYIKIDLTHETQFLIKYAMRHCFNFDVRNQKYQIDLLHWLKDLSALREINSLVDPSELREVITKLKNIRSCFFFPIDHVGTRWSYDNIVSLTCYPPNGLSFYTPVKELSAKKIEDYNRYVNPNFADPSKRGPFTNCPNWLKLLKCLNPSNPF